MVVLYFLAAWQLFLHSNVSLNGTRPTVVKNRNQNIDIKRYKVISICLCMFFHFCLSLLLFGDLFGF